MIEAPYLSRRQPTPPGARPDLRSLPARVVVPAAVHTMMIAGMLLVMLTGLPAVALVVALGFVVVSVTLAVPARHTSWAREAVIDLWAMALVLLAPMHGLIAGGAAAGGAAGHHSAGALALSVPPLLVIAVWAAARLLLLRRSPAVRHSVVTGVVCAAQLVLML